MTHFRGAASAARCAALACLFLGIAYVVTESWGNWDVWSQPKGATAFQQPDTVPESVDSLDTPAASDGTLAIRLHPEQHTHRPPHTIELDWTITAGLRAPDGVQKRVYLVNGAFPGPTIEARTGDTLVVRVTNGLTDEAASLHWHGLRLVGQNAMDGALGVTQCGVGPGGVFEYRVHIGDNEHGTFWWHSHVGGQRADGLYGGVVVHEGVEGVKGREGADIAVASAPEYLLLITDWFHAPATETQAWFSSYKHFGSEPVPDSLLVNGRGRFDCRMAVPARPVVCAAVADDRLALVPRVPATPTRWRIANVGSLAGFQLVVPGATLTPVALDGHAVQPVAGDGIGMLYPGERADMMVSGRLDRLYISLDKENLRYHNPSLRSNQSFPITPAAALDAAALEEEKMDSNGKNFYPAMPVALDTLHGATPLPPDWPAAADQTLVVYAKVQILAKYGNSPKGYMNHSSWAPQSPPLAALLRADWNANQLVPFVPTGAWVDLVINNLDDGAHPFHLHGYAFYVLARFRSGFRGGWGSYNPFEGHGRTDSLDTAPPLKDTVIVPRRGHVVLRFRADNPGLWMLHCHMAVHLGSGLAMALHVGAPAEEAHVVGKGGECAWPVG